MKNPRETKPSLTTLPTRVVYFALFVFHLKHILAEVADDTNNFDTHTTFVLPAVVKESRAQFYFRSQLLEITKAAMKMGGYDDEATEIGGDEYLKFLENVLLSELVNAKAQSDDISDGSIIMHDGRLPGSAINQKPIEIEKCDISSSRDVEATPEWHNYNFAKMYRHHNCREHASDRKKPLYDHGDWLQMRNYFWDLTDSPHAANYESNFKPPYYTDFSDGKGRGVFASRNIDKGELVHSGLENTVFFHNGAMWRKFIMSLPRNKACDVMEWSWIQHLSSSGKLVLCLNLDDAAFLNNGEEEDSNIKTVSETSLDLYAIRDIAKGEEIMFDYDGYDSYDTSFEHFFQ